MIQHADSASRNNGCEFGRSVEWCQELRGGRGERGDRGDRGDRGERPSGPREDRGERSGPPEGAAATNGDQPADVAVEVPAAVGDGDS